MFGSVHIWSSCCWPTWNWTISYCENWPGWVNLHPLRAMWRAWTKISRIMPPKGIYRIDTWQLFSQKFIFYLLGFFCFKKTSSSKHSTNFCSFVCSPLNHLVNRKKELCIVLFCCRKMSSFIPTVFFVQGCLWWPQRPPPLLTCVSVCVCAWYVW